MSTHPKSLFILPDQSIPKKEKLEESQSHNAKFQNDLNIEDIALILNQAPYYITQRPSKGLKISKDDSGQKDICAYTLKQLEENNLATDMIDYFIAKEGNLSERRLCLIIPDEHGIPSAYIVDLMEPNYIARNLFQNILQILSFNDACAVTNFLNQNKQIDEGTKKILTILSNNFLLSKKDQLSFMLNDKNILNCLAGLYNKVDFKYIGASTLTPENKAKVALSLSKICKSKPFNPSYSAPKAEADFYKTFIERTVSVLVFGNENIEKFYSDEMYDFQKGLGNDSKIQEAPSLLNKLIYIQKSESILHHLSQNASLNNLDPNSLKNVKSFIFKFQFLIHRKNLIKLLQWLDQAFKEHIGTIEKLVIKFTQSLEATNQNEVLAIQKAKRLISLFPLLKSKAVQLGIRPNFHLNFLVCDSDLNKISSLIEETLQQAQLKNHIIKQFLACFDASLISNLTSPEYFISEATGNFIRYQILSQLRQIQHSLKVNDQNVDSLELFLQTDNLIWDLLKAKPTRELLERYLSSLDLDFMQDFLIQEDRLSWLKSLNSHYILTWFQFREELTNKIDKLKPDNQSISHIVSKAYHLTLPGITANAFSSLSTIFENSEWLKLWQEFKVEQPKHLPNLVISRILFGMIRQTSAMLHQATDIANKTSQLLTDLCNTSGSYALGLGFGLYVADPYQHLQFLGASFLLQKAYQYITQPSLDQALKQYDSKSITKSFKQRESFLTHYYSLNPQNVSELYKAFATPPLLLGEKNSTQVTAKFTEQHTLLKTPTWQQGFLNAIKTNDSLEGDSNSKNLNVINSDLHLKIVEGYYESNDILILRDALLNKNKLKLRADNLVITANEQENYNNTYLLPPFLGNNGLTSLIETICIALLSGSEKQILFPYRMTTAQHWVTGQVTIKNNLISFIIHDSGNVYEKEPLFNSLKRYLQTQQILNEFLSQQERIMLCKDNKDRLMNIFFDDKKKSKINFKELGRSKIFSIQTDKQGSLKNTYCGGYSTRLMLSLTLKQNLDIKSENVWHCTSDNDIKLRFEDAELVKQFNPAKAQSFANRAEALHYLADAIYNKKVSEQKANTIKVISEIERLVKLLPSNNKERLRKEALGLAYDKNTQEVNKIIKDHLVNMYIKHKNLLLQNNPLLHFFQNHRNDIHKDTQLNSQVILKDLWEGFINILNAEYAEKNDVKKPLA